MTDMTIDQALAHVVVVESLSWLADARATVRFFDHEDGLRVRVAIRAGKEPDDFDAVLVPLADASPESLAESLSRARTEIEALTRRASLYAVPAEGLSD